MDGIHDMGGMEGFGPVPYVANEVATVDTRWEAFAGAAMFALLRSGKTNIDAHRHRIERIDPEQYLPITYWGRWLAAIESAAIDQGLTSIADIERHLESNGQDPHLGAPPRLAPVTALESRENESTFVRHIDRARRFEAGQTVVTQQDAPQAGHHRLPRYARGRTGTISRCYPAFTFPDTVAHGNGERPQYVYAVAFEGGELWGSEADPNQSCVLDLFEPYLSPAERN